MLKIGIFFEFPRNAKWIGCHKALPPPRRQTPNKQGDSWIFAGSRGATKGGHLPGTTISERFRELLKRADTDKPEISTHSIQHSTTTHLLENGASIRHVQELQRHTNIESTVRYTHVMTDNLAIVYPRFHPREHVLYEELDHEHGVKLARLIQAE